LARNLSIGRHRDVCGLISHSIFQPFRVLRGASVDKPAVTEKYTRRTALDLADSNVLGSLLIQYALRKNPDGVVLFSSTRARRLASNVREAGPRPFSEEQMA